MRKILLMLCLLLAHAAAMLADKYVLDATTLQSSTSGKASFNNGLTITNGGGQNYKPVWRN